MIDFIHEKQPFKWKSPFNLKTWLCNARILNITAPSQSTLQYRAIIDCFLKRKPNAMSMSEQRFTKDA